jgi:hypothetical protein
MVVTIGSGLRLINPCRKGYKRTCLACNEMGCYKLRQIIKAA